MILAIIIIILIVTNVSYSLGHYNYYNNNIQLFQFSNIIHSLGHSGQPIKSIARQTIREEIQENENGKNEK